jgi:hypothetical protein
MRSFDQDRDVAQDEWLGWFGDRRGIGDEIDHDSIGISADIELCEGCCRAQRGDAHACGPQRVRGIGSQRSERLFVVEEQVEISGLAVMSIEAGECSTAGQGPCWLQSRQRDEHLLLEC